MFISNRVVSSICTLFLLYSICSVHSKDAPSKRILERLLDKNDTNVDILLMVYSYDDFIIFLSTLHQYIGPRKDVKVLNDSFRIPLEPRRLYNLRGRNEQFIKDICGDQTTCDYNKRDLMMFKMPFSGSNYVLGVHQRANDTCVNMYRYSNFSPLNICIKMPQDRVVMVYKPLTTQKMFTFIVNRMILDQYFYFRADPPENISFTAPDKYFVVSKLFGDANEFAFLYHSDRLMVYSVNKTLHYFNIQKVREPQYTDHQGVDSIYLDGYFYSMIDILTEKPFSIDDSFYISTNYDANEKIFTIDLELWTGSTRMEHYPSNLAFKRTMFLFILVMIIIGLILSMIILFAHSTHTHLRRRRLFKEHKLKQAVVKIFNVQGELNTLENIMKGGPILAEEPKTTSTITTKEETKEMKDVKSSSKSTMTMPKKVLSISKAGKPPMAPRGLPKSKGPALPSTTVTRTLSKTSRLSNIGYDFKKVESKTGSTKPTKDASKSSSSVSTLKITTPNLTPKK